MSKGCDRTISIIPNIATIPEFVYRGKMIFLEKNMALKLWYLKLFVKFEEKTLLSPLMRPALCPGSPKNMDLNFQKIMQWRKLVQKALVTDQISTKMFAGKMHYIQQIYINSRYKQTRQIIYSRTGQNTQCNWEFTERETGQAQCSVFSQEGIAYNVNRCIDTRVCLLMNRSWKIYVWKSV